MPYEDPIPGLKRRLGVELARALEGWDAWDAAAMLHTDPPRVRDIRRGRLERFSLETLIRHLTRAKMVVFLTVKTARIVRIEARRNGGDDGGTGCRSATP